MSDSIFTKIVNKELPATIRYEDEDFLAINDIHPKAPVHVLLVTKKQFASLEEVAENDTAFHAKILMTARKVAKQLGINQNYKVCMNVGPNVQEVQHLHLHILGGWKFQQAAENQLPLVEF